jgi:pentatricopeptide repeat protein
MRDKEALVTVAEFENDFDAEIARVALETGGIRAVVLGGDLVANMPPLQEVRLRLQVLAGDVEKAKQILDEMEQQSGDFDGLDDFEDETR